MYPCAHPVVSPATPSSALESLFELPEDKLHVDHAYFRPRMLENLIARHLAPAPAPSCYKTGPGFSPRHSHFGRPNLFLSAQSNDSFHKGKEYITKKGSNLHVVSACVRG